MASPQDTVTGEDKYGYDDNRFEKAVDAHFHCSICYNVLKKPMMCRNNEHVFCRGCITEHLTVNSHTCPECNEDLTVETLRRGPRMVINYLSELKIRCDYSSRGCEEFIRLEELDTHVQNCGFAPVKCSNEECGIVVNKLELVHHESTVCEYRKVKSVCMKIEQDVKRMEKKMENLASKEDLEQVKAMIIKMFEKFGSLENTTPMLSATNGASTAPVLMEDILVAGGLDSDTQNNKALKSVEKFSWNNVWKPVSPLKISRMGATLFIYDNQVFVAGGSDSDVIEVLNLNERQLEWREGFTLPFHCARLLSVVYQNRAILFCTRNEDDISTDYCLELSLIEPYECKQLCKMPGPARMHYRVVAFECKVLIFGGTNGVDTLNDVLEFDLTTNEFKEMPPLSSGLKEMGAVRWGDQAVLTGGVNAQDWYSRKAYMYNSKTGKTIELPPMLEERVGCCAVITGDTIVVMGGRSRTGRVRSVEAFTMGGYSWRYLPAMNDIRSISAATVLPRITFP